MRAWLFVLALVALTFAPDAHAVASQAASGPDAEAVAAYRRGDLGGARTAWLSALEQPGLPDAERARILYDLGNVAYRSGSKLESVGWYSAALRLRPRDADTWANLEHARREAGLEPADRGDLAATLARAVGAFDEREARYLALLGLLAWGAALGFEALRGGRGARWTALAATVVAALLAVPCLHAASVRRADPLLVVEEGKALVRSEPRHDAAVIAEVEAGSEVERRDALPDWVAVELDDGAIGWLPARAVFALRR